MSQTVSSRSSKAPPYSIERTSSPDPPGMSYSFGAGDGGEGGENTGAGCTDALTTPYQRHEVFEDEPNTVGGDNNNNGETTASSFLGPLAKRFQNTLNWGVGNVVGGEGGTAAAASSDAKSRGGTSYATTSASKTVRRSGNGGGGDASTTRSVSTEKVSSSPSMAMCSEDMPRAAMSAAADSALASANAAAATTAAAAGATYHAVSSGLERSTSALPQWPFQGGGTGARGQGSSSPVPDVPGKEVSRARTTPTQPTTTMTTTTMTASASVGGTPQAAAASAATPAQQQPQPEQPQQQQQQRGISTDGQTPIVGNSSNNNDNNDNYTTGTMSPFPLLRHLTSMGDYYGDGADNNNNNNNRNNVGGDGGGGGGDDNNNDDDVDDDDDDDDDDERRGEMSLTELLYSSSSYHAIAKPVTLTMILAAMSVVFINDEQSLQQGEQALSDAYTVWKINESNNATRNLASSLGNALIMVSIICLMTFVIVALYRYRFMTCLIGYMMLSSAVLLGLLGGSLLATAIDVYEIPVDYPTYVFFLWNFAVVGVMAVFYGVGIPLYISQGYLILTSVILAWHLAHFDEWTAWTLLIMLALYDLCAVLTPCGPLKALVNLMSEEDSPDMPGLLYEAELPPEARRPGVPSSPPRSAQRSDLQQPGKNNNHNTNNAAAPKVDSAEEMTSGIVANRSTIVGSAGRGSVTELSADGDDGGDISHAALEQDREGPLVEIPLAIARVYNLVIVNIPTVQNNPDSARVSTSPLLETERIPENPTAKELRMIVTARLPLHGGRLERHGRKRMYLERDRFGTPKRHLWVDRQGKVFAELVESGGGDGGNGGPDGDSDSDPSSKRNSIRLGLGDFIFYSVLVAKAAQYSFATFVACTLVILAGLGGTLVLLSVYHHALPALPISIFLGVLFYIMTRLVLEPWMEHVLMNPYYV